MTNKTIDINEKSLFIKSVNEILKLADKEKENEEECKKQKYWHQLDNEKDPNNDMNCLRPQVVDQRAGRDVSIVSYDPPCGILKNYKSCEEKDEKEEKCKKQSDILIFRS